MGNTKMFSSVFFDTFFVFIILLILSRMLGKKQLSQLTFFNYIAGITIGTIAGNAIDVNQTSKIDNIIALTFFCFLTIFAGFLSLKWPKIRPLIEGEPTIVVKKGKIQQKALAQLNLNINLLTMLLRKKGSFSISEVEYAILEPNGKLSVLKKDPNDPQNINTIIPTEIIADGNLIGNNLKEFNLSEEWLKQELEKQGINDYNQVLYAELQKNKTLYVEKKEL